MRRTMRTQAATRSACTVCHRRKVRCNAHEVGFPCSNCRSASCEDDCQVHQKRKRRSVRHSFLDTPRSLPQPSPPGVVEAASNDPNGAPEPERHVPHSAMELDDEQFVSPGVVGVNIGPDDDGEYLYKRHLVEFIEQPSIAERPIDKNSRITYIGTDISNINFLLQQQFGGQATDVSHFPTNRLAHRHICPEPERLPVEAFHLPPRAIVDQLLDAYFCHVNPCFPVVDQDIFMAQYNQRDPLNPPSLLLLHAILVAGAHALYDRPRREASKLSFFRRAKSLFDARFERNRDTIVQAALLLTWHADGLEDVSANAWFWLGVAVRTATGLGMHKDAENSTLVPHNKRMWRRVWWLLFTCDTLVSLQYGRPQSIRLDESAVQKLRVSDFQDCGPHSDPDLAIQMTELCIIISAALRDRFRVNSTAESRALALLETDEALAHWSLNLPEGLQLHDASNAGAHSAILHMHYNTALILLHRALPGESLQPSDGVSHHDNSGICIAAAGVIQSVFRRLCDDEGIRRLWISSINCLFTALIQLSIEVRYLNPVLAVSALRRYDSAITSLRRLAEYWPNAQSILHFFESSVRQPWRVDKSGGGLPPRVPGSCAVNKDGESTSVAGDDSTQSQRLVPSSREITNAESQGTHDAYRFPTIQLPPSPVVAEAGYRERGEMIDSWQEFRDAFWQSPEFTDDVLFTF